MEEDITAERTFTGGVGSDMGAIPQVCEGLVAAFRALNIVSGGRNLLVLKFRGDPDYVAMGDTYESDSPQRSSINAALAHTPHREFQAMLDGSPTRGPMSLWDFYNAVPFYVRRRFPPHDRLEHGDYIDKHTQLVRMSRYKHSLSMKICEALLDFIPRQALSQAPPPATPLRRHRQRRLGTPGRNKVAPLDPLSQEYLVEFEKAHGPDGGLRHGWLGSFFFLICT
jgi:hypothetical protein